MTEATETKVKETSLSDNSQKIIESIEKMSVLELNELVKALEDKFGVIAAAPVAVAGAAAGADASGGDDDSSSTVSVVLTDCGDKKIQVLKAVREITGLGLKDGKGLVDGAPSVIKEGIKKTEADEYAKQLEEAGAKAEFK